jgi:hypothetical protein
MFVPRHSHRVSHFAQRNRRHIALLCLLALAIAPVPLARAQQHTSQGNCTHPDPSVWPDCPEAIAFLAKFQSALKSNNREAVAMLVNYPLLVTGAAGRSHVRSRAQLLASFDGIFTVAVRSAILKATPDDVWGNYQGFMVGDGVIWFDAIMPKDQPGSPPNLDAKYPFKILTVNRAP